jgi:hypothetical protein
MTPSTTFAPTRAARRAGACAFASIVVLRPMSMLRVVVVPSPSPGQGPPGFH